MHCDAFNFARRLYLWRIFGTLAMYASLLFFVAWEFVHFRPAGALAYALAILPAIPIVGVLIAHDFYLAEEKDAFLRSISVQSMLWSLGGTLAATTAWGFLEEFAQVPHVQLVLVFPLYCLFWAISAQLVLLRYR